MGRGKDCWGRNRKALSQYELEHICGLKSPPNSSLSQRAAAYPAACGRQVVCGIRQSIPSIRYAIGTVLIVSAPSPTEGQMKRPRSSRFVNRHDPCPSCQMILIRSPRRTLKMNKLPSNGSRFNASCTRRASPGNPFLMSVWPLISRTHASRNRNHRRPRTSSTRPSAAAATLASTCTRLPPPR